MRALIYDIEIKKGILGKGEEALAGYEYCAGWHDHANMGISCIGAYDYAEDRYRVFCEDNMHEFSEALDKADKIVGFNSVAFDNAVIAACWAPVCKLPVGWQAKSYDLLVEIWRAAGLSPAFNYKTHGGYGLDAVCERNFGTKKTGDGAKAPIFWQRGMIGNVIDYCLNDVRLTKQLLDKVQSNAPITCPKTGKALPVRMIA
jgi:hypothetical protein